MGRHKTDPSPVAVWLKCLVTDTRTGEIMTVEQEA